MINETRIFIEMEILYYLFITKVILIFIIIFCFLIISVTLNTLEESITYLYQCLCISGLNK